MATYDGPVGDSLRDRLLVLRRRIKNDLAKTQKATLSIDVLELNYLIDTYLLFGRIFHCLLAIKFLFNTVFDASRKHAVIGEAKSNE